MDDLISRQALMKELSDFVRASNNSDFARTPTWNDAVSLVGSMPSAQPYTEDEIQKIQDLEQAQFDKVYELGKQAAEPEPLTEKEQRIFLAAMDREMKVCEEVDRNYVREPYEDSLMRVCREIKRKVKGALWT